VFGHCGTQKVRDKSSVRFVKTECSSSVLSSANCSQLDPNVNVFSSPLSGSCAIAEMVSRHAKSNTLAIKMRNFFMLGSSKWAPSSHMKAIDRRRSRLINLCNRPEIFRNTAANSGEASLSCGDEFGALDCLVKLEDCSDVAAGRRSSITIGSKYEKKYSFPHHFEIIEKTEQKAVLLGCYSLLNPQANAENSENIDGSFVLAVKRAICTKTVRKTWEEGCCSLDRLSV
jgi:hypothetical protein